MKYRQKDFTNDLKIRIQETESALKEHMETLVRENRSLFKKRNLDFDADFDRKGPARFQPEYCSTNSIGISDGTLPTPELIDLHMMTI